MLDAFIINRIRRDRERARKDERVPLRPERPLPPRPEDRRMPRDEREERGIVEIDFHL